MKTLLVAMASIVALIATACAPLDEEENYIHYSIQIISEDTTLAAPSITFDLSCTQVFGGSGTYTQNSIVIAGNTGVVQVLSLKDCTLTLQSFSDGTYNYTPNPTPLVITINALGVVSSSETLNNPPSYINNQNTKLYLFLSGSTLNSLTFKFVYDPVPQTVTYIPA